MPTHKPFPTDGANCKDTICNDPKNDIVRTLKRKNPVSFLGRYKSCPYNWRRLWEGLRVGTGGGRVKPLSNKGLRKFLHFQQHAVVVPT